MTVTLGCISTCTFYLVPTHCHPTRGAAAGQPAVKVYVCMAIKKMEGEVGFGSALGAR